MSAASPHVQTGAVRDSVCRQDLAIFMHEFLGMEVGPHHIAWSVDVSGKRYIDIEAARGHGKSGFFSFAYPVWQSWRRKGSNGLIVSSTKAQVEEFFRILREGKTFTEDDTGITFKMPCLIDTPLAHIVPPDFERSWTGSKIHFLNKSRFIGRSMRTRLRGFHGSWIVVDDPHGREAGYSQLARDRDVSFIQGDLMPMLLPGGQFIIVGTPFHEQDIHAVNAKSHEWHHRKFPAKSVGPDGVERALWPALRPLSWLASRSRTMSSILFAQEYMLVPASSESSLFPASLFRSRPETLAEWLTLRPTPEQMRLREDWLYFGGVDLAMSASESGDYTVIVVLGVSPDGAMHIVELRRFRGMPYHEQLKTMVDVFTPYHDAGQLALVMIEANQMQRIFGDELRRLTSLPIRKMHTTSEKNDLARGVPSLRLYLENGKLRIPRGNAESQAATDVLMSEMQSFGWLNGKLQGVGQHDDTPMALWIATLAVRKGAGITFTSLDLDAPPGPDPEADDEPPAAWKPVPPDFESAVNNGRDTEAMGLAVKHDLVPSTCLLSPTDGPAYILATVTAGRSPCWTCNAPRGACKGAALRDDVVVLLPADAKPHRAPARPKPELVGDVADWLDVVAACGGDKHLARLIPQARAERARGYNALILGKDLPVWCKGATERGQQDALADALEVLLGVT